MRPGRKMFKVKNLSLQLVAGTYTFKIVVSTDGKYGEGFVNVTVQPRK